MDCDSNWDPDTSKVIFTGHVSINNSSSGLLDSRAALSNSYPKAWVPSRKAVCNIFMMVFGMTRPGLEPMTYQMRARHANH